MNEDEKIEERVQELVKKLKYHPDARVRARAADALGGIGEPAASAVPALAQALKDPDFDVRYWAAEALGNIGAPAASAVPALDNALRDPVADVRHNAAWALGMIGAPAVPALLQTAKKHPELRSLIQEALGKIKVSGNFGIREGLLEKADDGKRFKQILYETAIPKFRRAATNRQSRAFQRPGAR